VTNPNAARDVTETAPRPKIPREIWVLVAAAFIIAAGFGLVSPIIPQFARSFDVSTTAASAVAALSPQERALRDAALAAPEPQRPAQADQHDLTGAIAAAQYFITLYPYVYATGDLTAFRAMSDATCKFCDSVITNATSMHTAGGWEDPWEHHITFTSITADISTPNNRYVVEFHVVSDQHVSHRIGEPPHTNELIQGPVLVQVLWKDGSGWIIEGVNPQ